MEKTDAASMPLRQSSADEFLVIRNFMIAEGGLGLTGTQAYVYALIYQFSVDGKGAFFGSLAYLSSRCGISRRAAIMALQALKQRGLIAEYGVRSNGSRTKHYYAVPEKAEEAKEAYAAYWAAKRAAAGPGGAISAPARPRRDGENNAPEGLPNGAGNAPAGPPGDEKDALAGAENAPTGCGAPAVSCGDERPQVINKRDRTDRPDDGFTALADSTVNRNLIAAAEAPYRALLAEGFSPAEIFDAWQRRQRECELAGTPRSMYPQLKKWLEDRSVAGARMAARPRRRAERTDARSQAFAALALDAEGKLGPELSAAVKRATGPGNSLGAKSVAALAAVYREYATKEERHA